MGSQVALVVKNPPANAGDVRDTDLIPGSVGKIPWNTARQPALVFLPGEFHGERSLVDDSPQGCKESVTIKEHLACRSKLLVCKTLLSVRIIAI